MAIRWRVGLGVRLAVGEQVGVRVSVGVGLAVGEQVGRKVSVGVGLAVGEEAGVRVLVGVGVWNPVGVSVRVSVLGIAASVGVAEGEGCAGGVSDGIASDEAVGLAGWLSASTGAGGADSIGWPGAGAIGSSLGGGN